MTDIRAFLLARLDEDQQFAERADPGPWTYDPDHYWNSTREYRSMFGHDFVATHTDGYRTPIAGLGTHQAGCSPDGPHIAHHHPARVLAEVEAKRKMLDYVNDVEEKALDGNWWNLDWELPLKILALPYADHPDYRQEWKP